MATSSIVGPDLTVEDLQADLKIFEDRYKLSTRSFLEMYAAKDPLIQSIDEAAVWYLTNQSVDAVILPKQNQSLLEALTAIDNFLASGVKVNAPIVMAQQIVLAALKQAKSTHEVRRAPNPRTLLVLPSGNKRRQ